MTSVVTENIYEIQPFAWGELPDGWVRCKLPEISEINMGQSPPGRSYNCTGEGLPFFQGKADFGDRYPTVRVWCNNPKKIAQPGDVLISVRAPVGPTNVADRICAIGRGLAAITPLGNISTEIILFRLRLLEPELALSGTGSTFTAINKKGLENIEIDVPPLAEQTRIVEKVEELLARVNAVKKRLARVSRIIKRFRQAVLTAGCSGRLTADWRDMQPDLEAADKLVKRIFSKRQEKYVADCKKAREQGKSPPQKLENIVSRNVETIGLPEIPNEWTWVYLPFLGIMSRGKSKHRPRNAVHLYGGPYPFIQTGDIAQSGGRITSHQQTYSEAGLAQSHLWPASTVCITIAANIAASAILTYPACFPDSVVGLIPDQDLCFAEYAEFFIRTARSNIDQFAPATAQKNINIGILNDVAVPLPPHAEQEEIVRRVESLFKLAEVIENRVKATSLRAEKMIQAILAKAFRGQLVSTEADFARREGCAYEPASALLARIKADREANEVTREGM
jgi:type I restriction enzyme S subunit